MFKFSCPDCNSDVSIKINKNQVYYSNSILTNIQCKKCKCIFGISLCAIDNINIDGTNDPKELFKDSDGLKFTFYGGKI